jgi:DNA (cytosine-5)-methyltransferase 1
MGAKTGLYQVYDSYNKNIRKDGIVGTLTQESAGRKDMSQGFKIIIPEATKKGYAAPVLTPNRAEKRQNGRRFKEDGEDMFTLTGQDQHGVMIEKKIDIVGYVPGNSKNPER